ncbi:hypothetical protein JCGZ_18098 [Jatropha curcas]|uniref:Nuclease associated modular domain-containing protein n=1 Tax=Jatropha curcas TaxID=180498 RepID=A0A067KDT5_JATCU|nr:hypothetical protein JCGZ_18098 [Jatropha curcas]
MVYPVCSVLLQNCLKDFTRLTFWRLSITYSPSNRGSNTVLLPTLGYVVEYTNFQASMVHSNYNTSVLKSESGFGKHFQLKLGQDLAETVSAKEDSLLDSCQDSSRSPSDQKEKQTKRKRKHGNKGRVPWNKGRKHTAETRALIKKRTIEAWRDPQVKSC